MKNSTEYFPKGKLQRVWVAELLLLFSLPASRMIRVHSNQGHRIGGHFCVAVSGSGYLTMRKYLFRVFQQFLIVKFEQTGTVCGVKKKENREGRWTEIPEFWVSNQFLRESCYSCHKRFFLIENQVLECIHTALQY